MSSRAHQQEGGTRETRGRALVVYCTHGIADPLVAPLMLDYVVRLQRDRVFEHVLLFTEEPPDAHEPSWVQPLLRDARITWSPMRYDVRGRQWLQRGRNVLGMLWRAARFRFAHGRCWQVGYLSFGGAYAMSASWLGFGPCIVVCFEPHSHYMIELGIWPPRSLKARVVACTERWQLRKAAALIVPTTAVMKHAQAHSPKGRLAMQAITIDVDGSLFDAEARREARSRMSIPENAWVVGYVGKFGGIYHSVDQYLGFISALAQADHAMHFIIITHQDEIRRIEAHALALALKGRLHLLPPVPPEELSKCLSLSDVGVVAIPPAPGQSFRTPVKTAHYWSAGSPIIIPVGVSDDHRIAMEEDTGIAVHDLVPDSVPMVIEAFARWKAQGADAVRSRCVQCARAYRDTRSMLRVLRPMLEEHVH
ncbi:MAG: glycosyltransferase [Flavobacteriales bacterium]|nr:glycosyltransferase [Flavobacteriales bacterium]